MRLRPRTRKLLLTVHVSASVGWLGAVACFLALSALGLASDDPSIVRGAYRVMDSIGWFVLIPMSLASLVTGLAQAVATAWGVFRHYWVLFKLVINVFATVVLLLYMQTLEHFAAIAAASSDLGDLRSPSPILHAAAALVVLTVATTLAIYKPRGLTPYGRRKQREDAASRP